MNSLVSKLGIDLPLIQGAMAQISTAPLVGAVSEAGGLGVLASGGMSALEVEQEIVKIKAMTKRPFAVNIMLMMENCEEIIDVIIAQQVKIVTTGAGTPKPYMTKLKAAGIIVMPVVPNVAIAKKMEALGVDAVIAEGTEAGGHIGEVASLTLLSTMTKAVSIPIIAAGGFSDGKGLAAAFSLGASAVQMGSVYLATKECPISIAYKEKIIASTENDTLVTGRSSGTPVRVIKNQMAQTYIKMEQEELSREELEKLTLGSLRKAVVLGDMATGSVMAGQAIGNIQKIRSVQELHEVLLTEYRQVKLPQW